MLIIDIGIYFIFALIMSYFAKESWTKYPQSTKIDEYLWLYILFFTFIAAIRWCVGVDSISYLYAFKDGIVPEGRSHELLWTWFVKFIHNMGLHFTFGLGFAAFLQILFVTKGVRNAKFLLIMLPFVLFGGRYFLSLMNGVRQMIVACGFIWASQFIYKRKFWKYLLFVIIASYIHHSALMLIILYLIPNKLNISSHRNIALITLTICVILGLNPSFGVGMQYLGNIVDVFGYDEYSEFTVNRISDSDGQENLRFGPIMISYLSIAYFIIWFGPYLKKKFNDKVPNFNLWYNYSIIYSCAYFLVCNISHLFIRPVTYLENFQMIMAAMLLWAFRQDSKSSSKYKLLFYIFIAIIWICTIWGIIKSDPNGYEFVRYKVFWNHM